MRVGLFGGSFDPPHRGHLAVAQAARERFRLDRVLLAPTGRQPLKTAGSLAPFDDRLVMTGLLCGRDSAFEVSDLDRPRADGAPNYTVDTLAGLRAGLAADAEIFSIAGADAFLTLRKWREPERLLTLAEWIVVSRPGTEPQRLEELGLSPEQRARVHWLSGVCEPASATEIRARLVAGQDCRELVPEPVLRYIREHALYIAKRAT